ncbi:MAG: hypothetical protein WCJ70_01475 [bacterium]
MNTNQYVVSVIPAEAGIQWAVKVCEALNPDSSVIPMKIGIQVTAIAQMRRSRVVARDDSSLDL